MTGKVGLSYFEKNTPYANFTPILRQLMQTNPFIRKKRCSRAKEAYGNSDFKKPPDNGRLFDTMKKTEGRKKMDAHVISLANQKGGTAKTTTCANLGI